MRIGMVGTGYVGLVSGTCLAEFGTEVICVDKEQSKIDKLLAGEMPIYEPGLDRLVAKQINAKRLSFTTKIADAVKGSDAVFIAVGTPPRRIIGDADMQYVYTAAREIAKNLEGYTVVVTKSTVPVGTAREIERIIREENPKADFDIVSNPEFLREGAAIDDFMRPDRVVIGAETDRAKEIMREIYRPLYINETPIVMVSLETSELIKYASNAFLATKITFINEIADICEKTGANVQDVAKGMGIDNRIGSKFLHAGPGYGGSCFPKDTLALAQIGEKNDAPQTIVEQVIKVNASRQRKMAQKIINAFDGNIRGKKIAILGIAFKPNTDDVRDAPSLTIIPILQEAGAIISAYDPEARKQAEPQFENLEWKENPYEAAKDSDALVIITEWNEFRALNLKRIKEIMNGNIIIDLRNIYKLPEMKELNFHYISVGREEILPNQPDKIKKAS